VQQSDIGSDTTLKAAPRSYVVFGIMWGGMTTWVSATALQRSETDLIPEIVVCACALIVSYLWIAAFQLQLVGKNLRYRTLTGGNKVLSIVQIERIHARHIQLGRRLQSQGIQSITIYPKSSKNDASEITINARVFSTSKLLRFLELLRHLGVEVVID